MGYVVFDNIWGTCCECGQTIYCNLGMEKWIIYDTVPLVDCKEKAELNTMHKALK